MKMASRIRLFCMKTLRNGVEDRFTVIVPIEKKDAARKEYEIQGYKVY